VASIDLTIAESRARIVATPRRITHSAVCRVFDVGETEHRVLFDGAVDGEDGATLLRHGPSAGEKGSTSAGAVRRSRRAYQGLHRALKPANILIDEKGLVRITDFGIVAPDSAAGPEASGTGGRYLAPEQLVPGAPVSARTDLFALGLILYELLVGRPPFPASPDRRAPVRPSALVPEVDPGSTGRSWPRYRPIRHGGPRWQPTWRD
jgi:serine/threonine-protein kinase